MKKLLVAALLLISMPAYAQEDKAVSEMFKKCDANKDGKISKEEYNNEKMQNFDQYDSNKDGNLSMDEHKKMLKEHHEKLMGNNKAEHSNKTGQEKTNHDKKM